MILTLQPYMLHGSFQPFWPSQQVTGCKYDSTSLMLRLRLDCFRWQVECLSRGIVSPDRIETGAFWTSASANCFATVLCGGRGFVKGKLEAIAARYTVQNLYQLHGRKMKDKSTYLHWSSAFNISALDCHRQVTFKVRAPICCQCLHAGCLRKTSKQKWTDMNPEPQPQGIQNLLSNSAAGTAHTLARVPQVRLVEHGGLSGKEVHLVVAQLPFESL